MQFYERKNDKEIKEKKDGGKSFTLHIYYKRVFSKNESIK